MSRESPEGWKKVQLGDVITDIGDGGTPDRRNSEYFGGNIPWAVVDDVRLKIETTKETLTEAGLKACSAKLWPTRTVILTTGASIGRVGLANSPLATKQGITGIVCDDKKLLPEFLVRFFELKEKFINRIAQGSTFKEVRSPIIKRLDLLLPPLPEQQKIAAILSSVDDAIEKTKAVIEQTKVVKIGLMHELFTRGLPGQHKKFKKTVIGEVPEDWEIVKVGDVCDYIVPGRNKPKIFDGEIPWITTPDIIGRKVKTSQKSLSVSSDEIKRCGARTVPEGSVIMSCVGEFGVVTISADEMVINQQLHAFIPPEDLDANFLRYCLILQKPYMEKIATKTAVPYMNKFNCNSIPIPKPSIHEQKEIADVLLSLETKMEIEQTLLSNLNYIKNALMQGLLTGEVRVKITYCL